jgi:hypothetical protein
MDFAYVDPPTNTSMLTASRTQAAATRSHAPIRASDRFVRARIGAYVFLFHPEVCSTMLATSRPADRLVHNICVIVSAAIVGTLLSRPKRPRVTRKQPSIDVDRVRRLQLWGRWLAVPSVN